MDSLESLRMMAAALFSYRSQARGFRADFLGHNYAVLRRRRYMSSRDISHFAAAIPERTRDSVAFAPAIRFNGIRVLWLARPNRSVGISNSVKTAQEQHGESCPDSDSATPVSSGEDLEGSP